MNVLSVVINDCSQQKHKKITELSELFTSCCVHALSVVNIVRAVLTKSWRTTLYCVCDFLRYYFRREDWNFSVWQRFLGAGMFAHANDLFRLSQHTNTHSLSLSHTLSL